MNDVEKHRILIVDDDERVLQVLNEIFKDEYLVTCAASGAEAIARVNEDPQFAAVVLDIRMPGIDGITVGRQIRTIIPDTPIIFHTGYPGDYGEEELDAHERPFDYIEKGHSTTRLIRSVRNAVKAYELTIGGADLISTAETRYRMTGRSLIMQDLYRVIQKVAATNNKVMILGETGTGKELIARAIHCNSSRSDARLAILNCNHKSPDLIESELFGHRRGAFTGAVADRVGLFEYANGGTIFLDEIGDLDITSQAKLLRVLETGEFQKLGSPDVLRTDVRVLCATHRDLKKLVAKGEFREDLFYRLKGIVVTAPPLRDRREDIPRLVQVFAERYCQKNELSPCMFSPDGIAVLTSMEWPGNVRQLEDTVEAIIGLTDSQLILPADIEAVLGNDTSEAMLHTEKLSAKLKSIERTLILNALVATDYSITAAGQLLEIDRASLSKKIKAHKIDIFSLKM